MMTHTNGSLPSNLLTLAYKNNWFRLFVRKDFGGAELNLSEAMQELYKASEINGSLGWCVNLGSGASYFSGFLQPEVVKEKLSGDKSVFAGSGQIGTAKNTPQGIIISGSWERCTGSDHATTFTVNAADELGNVHSYLIDRNAVEIKNEWSMMGLNNSSTFAIKVHQTIVPHVHQFEIGKTIAESAYSVHYIPFDPFARCCMIASYLGMFSSFLEALKEEPTFTENRALKCEIAPTENSVDSFLKTMTDLASELEKNTGNRQEVEFISEKITREISEIMHLLDKQLIRLFRKGGLRLANKKTRANQAFSDLLVAGQHPLFQSDYLL